MGAGGFSLPVTIRRVLRGYSPLVNDHMLVWETEISCLSHIVSFILRRTFTNNGFEAFDSTNPLAN